MSLISLRDGSWSKTKIAAVLSGIISTAVAAGVLNLSAEQAAGLVGVLSSILAFFLRDGVDKAG